MTDSAEHTDPIEHIMTLYNELGDALAALKGKKGKKRRRGANKDENAPKRPLSPYFCYCKTVRAHPNQTVSITAAALGQRWKEMTEECRSQYVEMAEKDKVRYNTEMEAYKQQQGAR